MNIVADLNQKVVKFQMVEVTLTNFGAAGLINFPDQQNLRDVELVGIEVYSTTQVASAPSGATPVVPAVAELTRFTLNLENHKGVVFCPDIPAFSFHPFQGLGIVQPHTFVGQKVNWSKSQVHYLGGLGATRTILIGVFYCDPGAGNSNTPGRR